ncbi:MAG: T9SS type A sorting domain-containing protein [Bacteroidales bacterium]|nr:T9SS type A sorting domain-containing protein [Bacteroidales bacterium]
MKTITFTIFCMILCASIKMNYAQAPDWSRVLSSSPYDVQEGRAVVADENQHVYMAAAISGPVTFDGTVYLSTGKRDLLLTKCKSSGTTIWKKQINAQHGGFIVPQAINVDKKANIYVLCTFAGTVTIGNSILVSDVDHNVFIAKFNSSGKGVWATSYKYTGTGISKIALEGNGNSSVYISSFSTGLLKFSSSGVKLWEQNFPNRTLQAIAVDANMLYIGGALQRGTTTFGLLSLSTLGTSSFTGFIVKGDLNGNFSKSFIINGSTTSYGSVISDIAIDQKGDIFATGGYTKDLILGSIVIQNPVQAFYTFIAKCDRNFKFSWARTSSSFNIYWVEMYSYKIFTDNSGLIYQIGSTGNQFTFYYGNVAFNPVGENQFLFKFDPKGNALAAYSLLNSSKTGTIVTSAGKILSTGSLTYNGAASYGNIYLTQRNNSMSIDWQKISSSNQSGLLSTNGIKYDSEGNLYVLSKMRGYCNYFGIIIIHDNLTTLLAKHDPEGNVIWVKEIRDALENMYAYNSIGTRIILDEDKNVIIIGRFNNSLIVGYQTVLTSQTPWSDDGYVAKFDSNGQFQWAMKFDAEGSFGNVGFSVTADTKNNIIATGEFNGMMTVGGNLLYSDGLDGAFMVKISPDGNCIWAKGFPIGEVVYLAMSGTDGEDNIYFTGEMYNRTDKQLVFDALILPQTDDNAGNVLVKFDPDGNVLWGNLYGKVVGADNPECWPVGFKTDSDGYSYSWGWSMNNAIFGDFTLSNPLNGIFNYYLAKIDPTGNVIWATAVYAKTHIISYGELFDMDSKGNIYMGAQFIDTISLEGTLFKPQSINDFFIAKFSNEGAFQWLKTAPTSGGFGNSLSVFEEDVVTIAGSSVNDLVFDDLIYTGNGGASGILAMLGSLPSVFKGSDITPKIGKNSDAIFDVQVYPNPSNGQFTLQMFSETKGETGVTIYNLLGKAVKMLTFRIQSGITMEEIDISFLPKGIYTMVCKINGDTITRQVIVE